MERIRAILEGYEGIEEKKMFGRLSFMLRGIYVCGVADDLVVHVGPEQHAEDLEHPQTREMDFTGRPMNGCFYVNPQASKRTMIWRIGWAWASTSPLRYPQNDRAAADRTRWAPNTVHLR